MSCHKKEEIAHRKKKQDIVGQKVQVESLQ